jgi:methylenetetrahydrofolate--tRNA-(uracil-5-)-methyltransferase
VTFESIDMTKAFFASRYNKGNADYINCSMSQDEYERLTRELAAAEGAEVHGFDDSSVFEGCMPIEVMARRGADTPRYGPLKPVGITAPDGTKPYAVVQLRRDDAAGTLYNIVGFQTRLKFGEQKRVFCMIPGLEHAEFARYGVMHRNTYINSPQLLDRYYRLRKEPRIRFAGQITGVEGYVESMASGLLVGLETALELSGKPPINFPPETAIGTLAHYVSSSVSGDFQPMNINFGIIPPLEVKIKNKRDKNRALSRRSLAIIENIVSSL